MAALRPGPQDDALFVRQSSSELAEGVVEKILVLIEMNDMIAPTGVRQHSIPSRGFPRSVLPTVHGNGR
jgi:hypothetical protein